MYLIPKLILNMLIPVTGTSMCINCIMCMFNDINGTRLATDMKEREDKDNYVQPLRASYSQLFVVKRLKHYGPIFVGGKTRSITHQLGSFWFCK